MKYLLLLILIMACGFITYSPPLDHTVIGALFQYFSIVALTVLLPSTVFYLIIRKVL